MKNILLLLKDINKVLLSLYNTVLNTNFGGGGPVSTDFTWDAGTAYTTGEIVEYDDKLWQALQNNTGVTPTEGATWSEVSKSPSVIQEWQAGAYVEDEVYVISDNIPDKSGWWLVKLIDPVRPYNSTDINAEYTGGDWVVVSDGGGGAGVLYGVDSGVADAYVVSVGLTAYADGDIIWFKASNTNTGASTINVDGLGVKSITRQDGTALSAGDLTLGEINSIAYDGTKFQLLTPPEGAGGGGGGHTIQDEGTPLTQRTNLNLQGFLVEDDAGNNATKVTAPINIEGAVNKDLATNYVFKGKGKYAISATQTEAFSYEADGVNAISGLTFSVRTGSATTWETITFANLVSFLAGTFTTATELYSVGSATNWQVRAEASFGASAPSIDFGITLNLFDIPNA